jgi:hypothetical protein
MVRVSSVSSRDVPVPVTARLSKRSWFNAVDLTYRTELRELNEMNFARFDAKLEQRLAELRAELLTELRTGLADTRTELVRWMFGFWVTTLMALAGMLALRR